MISKTPPAPELSSFSPIVKRMYVKLEGKNKNIFRNLYKAMWTYLFKLSRMDDLSLLYGLPDVLENMPADTNVPDFFALIEIHFLTKAGKVCIDTRKYEYDAVHRNKLRRLMENGFLKRSTFDPLHPKNKCTQKVFISMTPQGIKFYKDVQKKLLDKAMKDSIKFLE